MVVTVHDKCGLHAMQSRLIAIFITGMYIHNMMYVSHNVTYLYALKKFYIVTLLLISPHVDSDTLWKTIFSLVPQREARDV